MLDTIQLKNTWAQLKKIGAQEEVKTETVPIDYTNREYRQIKVKGLTFNVRQEEYYDYLFEFLQEDDEVFLVHYHQEFWVTRDEKITQEEVKNIYQSNRKWKQAEKEKGYWMFGLSCFIHGGVALSLEGSFSGDPGGWDTSHIGLVLVSKEIAKTRKQAEKQAKVLIDYYNKLLSGDVYQIEVKKGRRRIDTNGIVGENEVYNFIKDYITNYK